MNAPLELIHFIGVTHPSPLLRGKSSSGKKLSHGRGEGHKKKPYLHDKALTK